MIEYRELQAEELEVGLFSKFKRHQVVNQRWKRAHGKWKLKEESSVIDWGKEDYETLVSCLKHTVNTGGLVLGAFSKGNLKAFVSVESAIFGQYKEYVEITSLHVSEDMRRRGIGKELFQKAAEWALSHGAKKVYLSSNAAKETQDFYRAMGCVEAMEYIPERVEKAVDDCQLEYTVDKEYGKQRAAKKKIFVKRPLREYTGVAVIFAVAIAMVIGVYLFLQVLGTSELEKLEAEEVTGIRYEVFEQDESIGTGEIEPAEVQDVTALLKEAKCGDKIPKKHAQKEETYTTYTLELKDGTSKTVTIGKMYVQVDDAIYVFQNQRTISDKFQNFSDSLVNEESETK